MTSHRGEALRELMLVIERFTLRRAWDGLTDDELTWEPQPGAWSIRPVGEVRTPNPFVDGGLAADMDAELAMSDEPEPMTTIAWLLWHVGSVPGRAAELDFLGGTRTAESGWTSPYLTAHPMPTSASDAVAAMEAGWRALDAALAEVTDEQLERPTRRWGYGGRGEMVTGSSIVASLLNEVSHHGTQICVLRDLYRVRGGV